MINTELRNPNTINIDKMTTIEMIEVMNRENYNAVKAVENASGSIAAAVDAIAARMINGGRLFYIGCGTSGRLGVLDASECPPTFGVGNDVVIGIIAGGDTALRNAVEGAEDSFESGVNDLKNYELTANDSVVGISAAGGANYVLGAVNFAKEQGALTVGVTNNTASPLAQNADIAIIADTGAEVITGSTRMKAGTSQKLILNAISTSVMVKMGYVYENLMINLKPSNVKLKKRMINIVSTITGKSAEESEKLLLDNGYNIKKAVSATQGK